MDSFSLLLVLFVLALFAVLAGVVLWRSNNKGNKIDEMVCGGCGYCVRGLATFQCPECGADLREAGIQQKKTSGAKLAGILLVSMGISTLTGIFLLILLVARDSTPYQPVVTPPNSNSPPNSANPF